MKLLLRNQMKQIGSFITYKNRERIGSLTLLLARLSALSIYKVRGSIIYRDHGVSTGKALCKERNKLRFTSSDMNMLVKKQII
jgi:hypothetical protein